MSAAETRMRAPAIAARLDVFFFQAEDGIRDVAVTGVQTCALPISAPRRGHAALAAAHGARPVDREAALPEGDRSPAVALGADRDGGPGRGPVAAARDRKSVV